MCIALLEPKAVAGEAYAPPPGAVGADTPLSQSELDAAVKAAAVQARGDALRCRWAVSRLCFLHILRCVRSGVFWERVAEVLSLGAMLGEGCRGVSAAAGPEAAPARTPPAGPVRPHGAAALPQRRAGRTRQGILGHLGRLVAMLEAGAGGAAAQETPFGLLAPPLGPARLKAVEVVAALLRLGSPSAEQGAPRPRPRRGRCAAVVSVLE